MHEAREAYAEARAALLTEDDYKHVTDEGQQRINDLQRELLEANAKPVEVPAKPKVHFQYYEPAEGTGGLPAVICTCGQSKRHLRFKVLEQWSAKHFKKTGHNTKPKEK